MYSKALVYPRHEASLQCRPAEMSPLALLAVAVFTTVFLLGSGIGALIYVTHSSSQAAARDAAAAAAEVERLKTERKELEEKLEKLNAEKLETEFKDMMKQGEQALAKRNYEEAEKAYEKALKLIPTDPDALKGLIVARTSAALSNEHMEERKAQYAKFMDQGKKAVADKAWSDAVTAFESAIQVLPGDGDANKALSDARAALAVVQNDKAKMADYQTRMDAGKAAMTAQRYVDAVREYLVALRLAPEDAAATKGLKDAEAKLDDNKDLEKRKADYSLAMIRGKASYKARSFDDAIDSYQTALKLMPADAEATACLTTARQGKKDARDECLRLIDKGTAAMQVGRYDEAVRLFTDATKQCPDDNVAKNDLITAQKALDTANNSQASYQRFMTQAAAANDALNYAESLRLYNQALLLQPNDVDALREIARLNKHLERDVVKKAEFDRHMQIGRFAFDKHQYADAVRAFNKAVLIFPEDLVVIKALHDANYAQAMVDGQAALNARLYKEAIRAYEAALLENPGDPAATNALEKAKLLARTTEGRGNPFKPTLPGSPMPKQ
jgi:tetratricopeptide (TPR) repeat protein